MRSTAEARVVAGGESPRWRSRVGLLCVFVVLALTVAVRVAWISGVPNEPLSDFLAYHRAAIGIAEGRGFAASETVRPIGYPGALSVLYALFRPDWAVAKWFNVALAAGTVAAFYALLLAVTRNKPVACLGSLALALYPEYVFLSGLVASENLAIFLTVVAALAFHQAYGGSGRARRPWAIGAGVAAWLATLTRPLSVLLLPAAAVGCCAMGIRDSRRCAGAFGVALVVALLGIGWWIGVNAALTGEVFFVAPSGGINLLIGNHPRATGTYRWPVEGFKTEGVALVENDRRAFREALAFIRMHPMTFLRRVPTKLAYLFSLRSDTLAWTIAGLPNRRFPNHALHAWLAALVKWALDALKVGAVLGAIASLRHARQLALEYAYVGLYIVSIAFYFGTARYRLPLVPFLVLLAVVGVWQTAVWVKLSLRKRFGSNTWSE